MTTGDLEALRAQLEREEGCRLKPYPDSVGKLTIGIGRNLTDDGITREEALALCDRDIAISLGELTAAFSWFAGLDVIRQRVLVDMAFNMGLGGLHAFQHMLTAIGQQHYDEAAQQMLASQWATQVKGRADRLAQMMRTGEDV